MSTTTGKVWIVGAGPGAPDLLTLRAARTIEQAEVLIWTDSLVNPQLAAMAPQDCERIRTSTLTLEEVMLLMLDRVEQGKRVVRLHDGDTCLYSALNEQLCRLLDADVAVEVVPGLSAYQATAARLNSELTIPGLVQTIVLGRAGGRTGVPESESLERLASLKASLCLYLSARHVEEVQRELLLHYPADTPVAIGYRVSWPDEWISVVPLKDIDRVSRERELIRTTLYVVSPALAAPGGPRSKLYSASHNHLFRGGAE
jgi:precorrin-4/cobalt-precorrin-4 C11-methyltransferase